MDTNPDANQLVQACLNHRQFAWQQFVDRFLPIILTTVQELDRKTSRGWQETEQHDLARMVFRQLRQDDYRLLREYDPAQDFETWLIVITRRLALAPQT